MTYDASGMPTGFRDIEKAAQDFARVIHTARLSDKQIIPVLTTFDIVVEHPSVITNPEHRAAFISQIKLLLKKTMEKLDPADKQAVAAMEFMNEPDYLPKKYLEEKGRVLPGIDLESTAKFIEMGNQAIRQETSMPVCFGLRTVDLDQSKTPFKPVIDGLKDGDIFQVHHYFYNSRENLFRLNGVELQNALRTELQAVADKVTALGLQKELPGDSVRCSQMFGQ
jgi:hypothetical protein